MTFTVLASKDRGDIEITPVAGTTGGNKTIAATAQGWTRSKQDQRRGYQLWATTEVLTLVYPDPTFMMEI
jgi:hypothetical protein